MRTINCWWDEKLTGLKSCEIIFGKEDDFHEYKAADPEASYDHIVVKIPAGNLVLVHSLEDAGFRYLENQLTISFEICQADKGSNIPKRKLSGFTYFKVDNRNKLDNLLSEVSAEMFESDRYSLDPFWKDNISSKRYINWISEMYEKGASDFYVLKKDDSEVGFFSIKPCSGATSSCPIAGIYNKYKSHGYFYALAWHWLNECRLKGNRRLIAAISSNNTPIHSFLSRVFSFRIDETMIVLRKVLNHHAGKS
jgi:hypothetical protein